MFCYKNNLKLNRESRTKKLLSLFTEKSELVGGFPEGLRGVHMVVTVTLVRVRGLSLLYGSRGQARWLARGVDI